MKQKSLTTTLEKPNYKVEYDYIPLYSTPEQQYLSLVFAKSYTEARAELYAKKRNQTDPETIMDQAKASKIFEYMVYNYLNDLKLDGVNITPPSIEIYTGRRRPSFDDDLTLMKDDGTRIPIHIKSQDIKRINSRMVMSWGFQKEDPIFTKKANDILVLGLYINESEGRLVSKDYVAKFKKYLAEPKSPKLIGIKDFLYYNPNEEIFRLIKK